MGHKSTEKNPKVRATFAIWGCTIGMLGVCIPLVTITKTGIILPLMVILGTGAGTVAVWFAPEKRQQEEAYLTQTVKALEERVINLETIYTSLPDTTQSFSLPKTEDHL